MIVTGLLLTGSRGIEGIGQHRLHEVEHPQRDLCSVSTQKRRSSRNSGWKTASTADDGDLPILGGTRAELRDVCTGRGIGCRLSTSLRGRVDGRPSPASSTAHTSGGKRLPRVHPTVAGDEAGGCPRPRCAPSIMRGTENARIHQDTGAGTRLPHGTYGRRRPGSRWIAPGPLPFLPSSLARHRHRLRHPPDHPPDAPSTSACSFFGATRQYDSTTCSRSSASPIEPRRMPIHPLTPTYGGEK